MGEEEGEWEGEGGGGGGAGAGGGGEGVGGGCPAPLGVISGAGRELAVKLVVNTRKTGVNLELYQERERERDL